MHVNDYMGFLRLGRLDVKKAMAASIAGKVKTEVKEGRSLYGS
jgi:hypothetical protein